MCHRQGDIDCAHPCLTTMYKATQKQTWNHGGPLLVCPQRRTSKFSRNQFAPPENTKTTIHGTTYRFQEEDAADGTSFAPFGPCKNTPQFLSSETEHSTINAGTENCTNTTKKEEDLTTRLSPSSLRPVSFK